MSGSSLDEILATCQLLLDHPVENQKDSAKLAGLLMIMHLPEDLVLRVIKDYSIASSLWTNLSKNNFLTRILLAPASGK